MATKERKEEASAAPVFTKAELLEAAALFGVSREILAGALYGVAEATKDQAVNLVKKFTTEEVKR